MNQFLFIVIQLSCGQYLTKWCWYVKNGIDEDQNDDDDDDNDDNDDDDDDDNDDEDDDDDDDDDEEEDDLFVVWLHHIWLWQPGWGGREPKPTISAA